MIEDKREAETRFEHQMTWLREQNPWQGTIAERKEKFRTAFIKLMEAAEMDTDGWQLKFDIPSRFSQWHSSGFSGVHFESKTVILQGRLSVITLLHEFGHIYLGRDANHDAVQQFAVRIFAKVFPDKFEKLTALENGRFFIK